MCILVVHGSDLSVAVGFVENLPLSLVLGKTNAGHYAHGAVATTPALSATAIASAFLIDAAWQARSSAQTVHAGALVRTLTTGAATAIIATLFALALLLALRNTLPRGIARLREATGAAHPATAVGTALFAGAFGLTGILAKTVGANLAKATTAARAIAAIRSTLHASTLWQAVGLAKSIEARVVDLAGTTAPATPIITTLLPGAIGRTRRCAVAVLADSIAEALPTSATTTIIAALLPGAVGYTSTTGTTTEESDL